ncbi:peptidoglycan-binding domain-containing protein [Egbenema bharatensis]|uniref:peptidoglycan-binding domain-containing protein n=1 Tax=Egbenema bharatensis TaxID=3463334 RepID=UPI003A880A66
MESLAYLHLMQSYQESECDEALLLPVQNGVTAQTSFNPSQWSILLLGIMAGGLSLSFAEAAAASAYYKDYAGGGFFYIFDYQDAHKQVVFVPVAPTAVHPLAVKRVDAPSHPTPAPTPSHSFCKVLRPGDSGDDVRCLQEQLQQLGYFHGPLTGYYGPITKAAVIDFQRDCGLRVDGVAGPQTLARLSELTGRG